MEYELWLDVVMEDSEWLMSDRESKFGRRGRTWWL